MVLRSYLETHQDLTLDRLKKILRSHYGAKNTSELYQALASLCQSPKESLQAFLMNDLDLRQQISFACGEGDDNTSLYCMTLDMHNVYFFGQLKLVYNMKAFVLRFAHS